MTASPLSSALLRLATATALVGLGGCGALWAPAVAAPQLRSDQCVDEVTRRTVARDLGVRCESESAEDTFAAGPRAETTSTSAPARGAPHASSNLGSDIVIGTVGLGILGGTIYCAVKCPEPLDTVVPATLGGGLALLLVLAIATADWSRYAGH